jgi:hypothetical protein
VVFSVSSTNKTDHHNITEILLKVNQTTSNFSNLEKLDVVWLTFNNISVILWWSVLLVEETEKTTDLSEVTDKLYHLMLYTSH